ncbi:MAG: SMC-Scp complex subunit ScpB [Cyanobacteria bacterium J06598_1]
MSRLANKIEAILYLKAQPLKIGQIAEFAQCDKDSAQDGLIELMSAYSHREGALEIAETSEGYALQLREIYKPLVDTIVPLDIGLGALRTLAAIALRGPIAQSELVDVRGSGVYQHVPDLVDQGFVRKRRQSDGRSSWLQVTEKFYQHFEIDKLPQIESLRLPKQKDLPLDETTDDGTRLAADSAEAMEAGLPETTAAEEDSTGEIEGIASDEAIDEILKAEAEDMPPENSAEDASDISAAAEAGNTESSLS